MLPPNPPEWVSEDQQENGTGRPRDLRVSCSLEHWEKPETGLWPIQSLLSGPCEQELPAKSTATELCPVPASAVSPFSVALVSLTWPAWHLYKHPVAHFLQKAPLGIYSSGLLFHFSPN